jgi:signal peptidase I
MNVNFALILFWATVVTGIFWFAELLFFKRKRHAAYAEAVKALDGRLASVPEADRARQREVADAGLQRDVLRQPAWLEFPGSFFPVIAAVFFLRSFLAEPFKIPSGSMIPTLQIGDFILVNKYAYGVRLPVIHKKIADVGDPKRGDVMVFRYPPDPTMDYIKRVVGVPGDKIAYQNKKLTVNGQPVPTVAQPDYLHKDEIKYAKQFSEKIGEKEHRVLNDEDRPAAIYAAGNFVFRENCNYTDQGVTCMVPPGHYFLMGDNRDNSLDSRFWGFVPEANIVGKAFFVWMNFGDLGRIGGFN